MTVYPFPSQIALDVTGSLVTSGSGQIYAYADTGFATPLALTDESGAAKSTVAISDIGATEYFNTTDEGVVWWKSGSLPAVALVSFQGYADAASASQVAAEAAQTAAEGAQAIVQATPDDATASYIDDVTSATRTSLAALYGAVVAPGTTTPALQTLIDSAAAAGAPILLLAGTHSTTATLNLPSGTRVDAQPGAVLDISSVPDGDPGMAVTGAWATAVSLSANATAGTSTITVASAAGLAAGDLLKVSSTQSFGSTSQPRGEIIQIESISGTDLTLTAPLEDSYPTSASAQIEKMSPVTGIRVRGLTVRGDESATTKDVVGIYVDTATDVQIDADFQWCHTGGIYLADVVDFSIAGRHRDSLRAGYGYGVAILWACQNGTVTGMRGSRLRHLVTMGGGSSRAGIVRGMAVVGCVASQMFDAGFDVHPGAEGVSFTGCVVRGSDSDGFVSQGGKITLTGCVATDITRHGILVQNLTIRGIDVAIVGASVARTGSRGITLVPDTSGETAWRVWAGFNLTGCNVADTGAACVSVENSTGTYWIDNVSITGCVVKGSATYGVFLRGTSGGSVQATVSDTGAASEALYLNDAPDTVVHGCLIDVDTTARGMRLVGAPGSVISGCRVKNPSGIGIMTDTASTGTLIDGVVITASTRTSIGAGTTLGDNV